MNICQFGKNKQIHELDGFSLKYRIFIGICILLPREILAFCLKCHKIYRVRVMLMVFNATFNNISLLYRGGQLYWWRKSEYPEKTTDLQKVAD
jgi:hypothetical protein